VPFAALRTFAAQAANEKSVMRFIFIIWLLKYAMFYQSDLKI